MMVTSEMLYIFSSCIIKSSIYAVFCFVSLRDRIFILFLLITWPEYLFLKSKFQIPLRIKWPSPKRHICGPREGEVPFFVLGYRQVKKISLFNRTFPVSSLSFFFLPCLVIFALNYVSVSFDILKQINGFWNKTARLMERSESAHEIHVHCRTVWFVVNCCMRYNDLCCRLR
jgi:hypothetical protein